MPKYIAHIAAEQAGCIWRQYFVRDVSHDARSMTPITAHSFYGYYSLVATTGFCAWDMAFVPVATIKNQIKALIKIIGTLIQST